MSLFDKCKKFDAADKIISLGLYPYFRIIESDQDTSVRINNQDILMFGSNSYLGLTTHPYVKQKSIDIIKEYGTGCAGSRFLNGTLDIHIKLENELADFIDKEAALVYSTGFQVNLGVISSLVGHNDIVFLDRLNHASIIDGCRLSFGKIKKYRHNDMSELEEKLKNTDIDKGKLIIVDGVFSMEGDIADLPQICQLAKKYKAKVMVDDAHGLGVLGKNGKGTSNHFNLSDKVDLIMGTFSKSLASIGGFIAGDKIIIDYLKHTSRSLIFSASLPPGNAAAVLASLEIIKNEPELVAKLWQNTNYMLKLLKKTKLNTGNSNTPIIPIIIGDDITTFKMCKLLQSKGVFVNPVVSPATEPDKALIRLSLMASHSFEQIDKAVQAIIESAKELNIIN